MACVANANNQRPARLELSKHILNCRRVSVRTRHKATIISFGGPIRTGLICFVHPVYTKRSHRPPRTRIAQEYLRQVDTPRTGCCTTFDVPPGKRSSSKRDMEPIYMPSSGTPAWRTCGAKLRARQRCTLTGGQPPKSTELASAVTKSLAPSCCSI